MIKSLGSENVEGIENVDIFWKNFMRANHNFAFSIHLGNEEKKAKRLNNTSA